MKFAGRNLLYLFIFGITLIGSYKLVDSKANTAQDTGPQTVEAIITEMQHVNPEVKEWIVISENALPNIPGRIYVLKTEASAEIWHTHATTRSENGEIISDAGSNLSEKQKLDLLNTGVVPKGWEVVYVDEEGNPI